MSVLESALLTVVIGLPIAGAWILWLRRDVQRTASRRRSAASIGLTAATLSGIGFIAGMLHIRSAGGYLGNPRIFELWAQASLSIGVIGFVLLLFGRGGSRLLGCLSSVVVVALWVIVAMGS